MVVFSLHLVVFRSYLYEHLVSLIYLILEQGKPPFQPAYAFTRTQEAELMPSSWSRLQNSFQVARAQMILGNPLQFKYMVPFIHLQNTIPKKTLAKIAFTPWLSMSTSGKGSSTLSLVFSFFIKAILNFLGGITHPIPHSLSPHLLFLQVHRACHIYRHLQVFYQTC